MSLALTTTRRDGRARGLRDRQDLRAADAGSRTWRGLTIGYVVALSLIAALTLGGGWVLSDLVRQQSEDASLINMAGAQRMLSQRVVAKLAQADLAEDPPLRALTLRETQEALARMAASHRRLTEGEAAPARRSAELAALYFGPVDPLDARLRRFLARASALVAAERAGTATPALRAEVSQEALGPLLLALNEAVTLHQEAARRHMDAVLRLHHMLVALGLALLLAEGLFIFRPLAGRVAETARRLERDAKLDPLTGLLNRRAVSAALAGAIAAGRPVAVIKLDLDWFKEVNDAEGQAAGDALLRAVAERLSAQARRTDIVGRLDGDEFVVLLPGCATQDEAMSAARRLRGAVCRPVMHRGRALRLAATLGVALAPLDAPEAELALAAADQALLRAKRERRGGIGRASAEVTERLARERAILRAFDAAGDGALPGLTAHLQPIVSLGGGAGGHGILGFEALARWTHPELGPVAPAEFIPLAERVGRACWLDRQVRREGLRILARLRLAGLPAPRLSVNLSMAELVAGGLTASLEAELAEAGLSLDAVTVEITEEVLLDRVGPALLDQLAALRGRGARLALDDFGTGHSGMAHLLRLPIDVLKLDRAFIRGLGSDGRAREIVRATVAMAEGLGMRVVAEGVETEQQGAMARALGCVAAQGYLFARPMGEEELTEWVRRRALAEEAAALLRA
jgi:diguanylate cyclase (GGDEF)-like protein